MTTISTLFFAGFPSDFNPREFHNLFTFMPGFVASSLQRIPAPSKLESNLIGFARFDTLENALSALAALNGVQLDPRHSCRLRVELAKKNLYVKEEEEKVSGGLTEYGFDPFGDEEEENYSKIFGRNCGIGNGVQVWLGKERKEHVWGPIGRPVASSK